jgi:hypothetical protein
MTMTQLSLFDDGPQLARASDPVTSKIAAKEFNQQRDKVKRAFLTALADLGGGPATAREIGERAKEMGLHGEVESVRKRAAELDKAGLITFDELRRCGFTGKLAEGWKLT